MSDHGKIRDRRVLTQPRAASFVGGLALLVLAVAWLPAPHPLGGDPESTALISVILMAGVVLAYLFPIHLGYHLKIEVNTVPLYLMAVLLPPAVAATAAGAGILVAELAVRARRGSYVSDIVTATGRFVIVIMLAALVAHFPKGIGPLAVLPLLGAALILWAGDMLTMPFVLVSMTGDPALRLMRNFVQESSTVEGVQYAVGFLGALAIAEQTWVLPVLVVPIAMIYRVGKSSKELHEGTRFLLERIADTIDLRDPYTGGHSRRVMGLTGRVLEELQITGAAAAIVLIAARLHDLGKIGVPDLILHKTGPLTAEEWAVLRLHPAQGADLLRDFPGFAHGVEVVRHHHENWDGSGYPLRLKGRDIPLGARIIAVIDSYDAMTSDRPYRPARGARLAAEILRQGRGTQWDPEIVDAFLRVIADELERDNAPRLQLVRPPYEESAGAQARPA